MSAKTTPLKNCSPENSVFILKNYGVSSLNSKAHNKLALQKELQLPVAKENIVLGLTTELTSKQQTDSFLEILQAALEIHLQIIIRACGTQEYQEKIEEFEKKYPKQLRIIQDTEEDINKLYAAADISLFLVDNKHTQEERECMMKFGVVPLSIPAEALENYNAQEESGNSFIISQNNVWGIFEALVRAKENYKFAYDWKNLQMSCMGLIS